MFKGKDYTAQGPSESDLGVSTRWHWTLLAHTFSQDSPKMYPGCPKLAPEMTRATLKISQDSPKMFPGLFKIAPRWSQVPLEFARDSSKVKSIGPSPKVQGPEEGRRAPVGFAVKDFLKISKTFSRFQCKRSVGLRPTPKTRAKARVFVRLYWNLKKVFEILRKSSKS